MSLEVLKMRAAYNSCGEWFQDMGDFYSAYLVLTVILKSTYRTRGKALRDRPRMHYEKTVA